MPAARSSTSKCLLRSWQLLSEKTPIKYTILKSELTCALPNSQHSPKHTAVIFAPWQCPRRVRVYFVRYVSRPHPFRFRLFKYRRVGSVYAAVQGPSLGHVFPDSSLGSNCLHSDCTDLQKCCWTYQEKKKGTQSPGRGSTLCARPLRGQHWPPPRGRR